MLFISYRQVSKWDESISSAYWYNSKLPCVSLRRLGECSPDSVYWLNKNIWHFMIFLFCKQSFSMSLGHWQQNYPLLTLKDIKGYKDCAVRLCTYLWDQNFLHLNLSAIHLPNFTWCVEFRIFVEI